MLIYPGELEVRKRKGGGRIIRGRFPYNKRAVLTDGGDKGRPVKETFKPQAFQFRIDDETAEIFLLSGHDYGKPLASKLTRTLSLIDTAAALTFEAIITEQVLKTS
ncbi:MAG: HK97 family phage prohead protease, partial [Burkholderiaceae bacterium]|nr:HK97 family phage prohead protease [Burkholderiaceae bacterium]